MKFISASIVLLLALSAYATSPIPRPSPEDVKECLSAIVPPDFEAPEPAPESFEELKALIKEKAPEFRAKLEEHFKKFKEEAEAAGGYQAGEAEEGAPEKRDSEPQKPLPPPPGPPPPGPPPPYWIRDCLQAAVGDDVELPENMPPNLEILHMALMGITGHFPPPPPPEKPE